MSGRVPTPQPGRVVLWRFRRNPLRRRSDLAQAWIGLGLLVSTAVATAPAVVVVEDAALRHYTRTARQQAETRQRTTAVLLQDARRHPEPGSAEARTTRYPVKVRFTDPHGHRRTATAEVEPGLPAGSTVRVWAGTDGQLTEAPLSPGEVRDRARGCAVLAALGVPATAATAYTVAGRVIQRRNLAAWATAWAATAPRWTAPP
ncbi:hypothetical protein AB0K80_31660 [Streptomyces sp. NPDC052682]|uniref:Rv1733c family protein n=1 Tax=Streptomyces sp. NPDC052682 TaxID=3154954 RepID=UPI00341FBB50